MHKSKEVSQEDLSWGVSQLLLRRHGLSGWEHSLNFWFTQLLFSEGAVLSTTTPLEGIISLFIRSTHYILSVPRFSFSFTLPLLCAVAALCYTCASRAAWLSRLQRRDQQLGGHQVPALCTPDGWDQAMSLKLLCLTTAGSLIQSQCTHSLLGWVHIWQHLSFMFCVWFTIKIGKNPTNLNSFKKG